MPVVQTTSTLAVPHSVKISQNVLRILWMKPLLGA
jgi:hypothetical protein